eukprot:scaffold5477_cov165-Skeletonema_marinoi.AAC.2
MGRRDEYSLDDYDETTQGDTTADVESSYAGSSNQNSKAVNVSGLNRKLRTEFIDLDPEDESILANLIRGIVGLVGALFSPRQILVALRLLKAVTVSMIALTATANLVYVAMVEFVAQPYVDNSYFGIRRDTVLRVYGLGLSVLALMIEMDKFTMKNFKVLKGFIARFVLLFFVACLTYVHPAQWANANNAVPGSAVMFQMSLRSSFSSRVVDTVDAENKASTTSVDDGSGRSLGSRLRVAASLASAVDYLHSQGVIYRDLKTDNVGFDRNGNLKLFDFGMARFMPRHGDACEDVFEMTGLGTPRYTSPEYSFISPITSRL